MCVCVILVRTVTLCVCVCVFLVRTVLTPLCLLCIVCIYLHPFFVDSRSGQHGDVDDSDDDESIKVDGGTSKRVYRRGKCTVGDCDNNVVQGGLCVAHGAKCKQCNHPGCIKPSRKAGLCSAHGPAGKRCDFEDCGKAARQGGRCDRHYTTEVADLVTAAREEKKRKKAKEISKQKALQEEKKRKRAEEMSKQKALQEEKKRKRAEEMSERKEGEKQKVSLYFMFCFCCVVS